MSASAASLRRVASVTARRLVRALWSAARVLACMESVHLLDEYLDLAAAGEANVPGLLICDAEIEQPRLAVLDRRQRFLDHSPFDATARDRAHHGTAVVDAELATDRPRRGSPGGDHGGDGDAFTRVLPLAHLVENFQCV